MKQNTVAILFKPGFPAHRISSGRRPRRAPRPRSGEIDVYARVAEVVTRTMDRAPAAVLPEADLAALGADDLDAEEIVSYCETALSLPEGAVWSRVATRPCRLTVQGISNLCSTCLHTQR